MSLLNLAARHAFENARTQGEAVVCAVIVETEPRLPTYLLHARHFGFGERLHGSHALLPNVVSEHSVNITAIAHTGPELLGGSYLILSDLFQGFGVAEPLQLTPHGEVRRRYYGRDVQQALAPWAESTGVTVVDSTVESEP